MSKKDIEENLFEHSKAKVRLLDEYLRRYLNIISNDGYTEKIKIYDLFCGEGLYKNGGEGSPLIIMRAIKDLYYSNLAKGKKVPIIDCQFNDKSSSKIQNVKDSIKNKNLYYEVFGSINYTSNDYNDEVKRLSEEIPKLKNQKAFIFIDPYEYKHIKARDIKALLSKKNAEVLLFLPTQFMYRFDKNGTPEALIDFIEEIVDYKDWKQNDNVWKFIEQLKESFETYLGASFFVEKFTIQKDANTVFCLYFFSSHIKGFEKMIEAIWEIDPQYGKGWDFKKHNPSLFTELRIKFLERKLIEFIKSGHVSNRDIYRFTLNKGFLPKHTNGILISLQNDGSLVVEESPGVSARKRSFYISYNHYKNDFDKVKFKLN